MTATFIVGDTLAVLPTLPAGSVDLVVTSPPFLALRSYLPADHPAKALEHGSEATPAAFLAVLLDVTAELDRVLAPHGSLAVELGDTYSGSGGAGGDYAEDGMRAGQPAFNGSARTAAGSRYGADPRRPGTSSRGTGGVGWPAGKSLCLIPSLYAACLAYGRNPLALPGQPEWREFEPWRVRNLVAWVRPNPPVGALGDKFRPATSYITIATRARDRWWDDIPIRKPMAESTAARGMGYKRGAIGQTASSPSPKHNMPLTGAHPAGAPLLDWWEVTPTGFTSQLGAHYATFPPALVEPLVEAMCPRRVCTACGQPSRRIVERDGGSFHDHQDDAERGRNRPNPRKECDRVQRASTVGWSTCGCLGADGIRDDGYHTGRAWRPGMVLDPYAGTATTLAVAVGHSRDAVGIDLNPANAFLVEERLGMFVTVVDPAEGRDRVAHEGVA